MVKRTGWGTRHTRNMQPQPTSHIRIARPSRDLNQAERFWVGGLGLEVLYRADTKVEGEDSLLMLGWPQAAWHLELVGDPGTDMAPTPTAEDLLVVYIEGPVDDQSIDRLIRSGGHRVAAHNPYWDRWGVTIVDPDGYRLVLSSRSWG